MEMNGWDGMPSYEDCPESDAGWENEGMPGYEDCPEEGGAA